MLPDLETLIARGEQIVDSLEAPHYQYNLSAGEAANSLRWLISEAKYVARADIEEAKKMLEWAR